MSVTETVFADHEPSHDPDERALFSRLAASMARHRKAVILVWVAVTLAAPPVDSAFALGQRSAG